MPEPTEQEADRLRVIEAVCGVLFEVHCAGGWTLGAVAYQIAERCGVPLDGLQNRLHLAGLLTVNNCLGD